MGVGNEGAWAPRLGGKVEPMLNDPDFKLESAFKSYTETGNPYFAWEAVKVCNSHNKPFPDWLCTYLGDCANRLTSPEAASVIALEVGGAGVYNDEPYADLEVSNLNAYAIHRLRNLEHARDKMGIDSVDIKIHVYQKEDARDR